MAQKSVALLDVVGGNDFLGSKNSLQPLRYISRSCLQSSLESIEGLGEEAPGQGRILAPIPEYILNCTCDQSTFCWY